MLANSIFYRRIDCWEDTQRMAEKIADPPASIKVVHDPHLQMPKRFLTSEVSVWDEDAIDLSARYGRALVLNLADDCFPGGCVRHGSGAQEESLFRRTNYHRTLTMGFYPVREKEAIYSPGVTLFKGAEDALWKEIPKRSVDFIACPAVKFPSVVHNATKQRDELSDTDAEMLRIKIETIIQTAWRYSYDTIVFGAMGCGAWKNPPEHVAEIFKRTLEKHDGVVQNYVFAILTTRDEQQIIRQRDRMTRKSNVEIFREVLLGAAAAALGV